jgi:hypothetical protein
VSQHAYDFEICFCLFYKRKKLTYLNSCITLFCGCAKKCPSSCQKLVSFELKALVAGVNLTGSLTAVPNVGLVFVPEAEYSIWDLYSAPSAEY